MKFKIPFVLADLERIKKRPLTFIRFIKHKKKSDLQYYLDNSDTGLTREQYLNMCIWSFIKSFLTVFILLTIILLVLRVSQFYLWSFVVALVCAIFVSINQLVYPKLYLSRKVKDIEKNLIPALEDMMVQLTSGISLFTILLNISSSDYGELSNEFKKAAKQISAGAPQIDTLENLGERNPSIFFRRALWQISNAMKAGSDISVVIKDIIKSLNSEQLIQIQEYGNRLNPLVMFYMLISVIVPALSIAFLTIISSLVGLERNVTIVIYVTLFALTIFMQLMFLGVIRSAKPRLL